MSECRDKACYGYAERRGNEVEDFNGWPKAGVVILNLKST